MSEVATTADPEAVTESAPSSTVEIASQAYDSLEAETEQAEAAVSDTPAIGAAETPAAETAAAPALSDEDQAIEALLAEFGFKDARKPDGREHYIPRSKVLRMIGSGLKRGQEKWTTERGVLESQTKELREHFDQLRAGVAGDPKAFLSELAQIDPRYSAFLQQQAAPQPEVKPAPSAEMPGPDVDLGNGSRTYSVEGIQKLIEWAVDAKMLPKVDERLKPLTEREQAEKQRAEAEQAQRAVQERARQQLTDAESWPGFKDHKDDIFKALQDDSAKAKAEGRRPTLTLEAAYRQVVVPRLIEGDTEKRARLLKELGTAAKASPAVARAGAEAVKAPAMHSTRDIAARVAASMER